MRLIRGGDHATHLVTLDLGIDRGPSFLTDPRRGCAPGRVDPDVFYDPDSMNAARAICARCMFKNQCDKYAAETRQIWGVWGGHNRNPRMARRQLADEDVS